MNLELEERSAKGCERGVESLPSSSFSLVRSTTTPPYGPIYFPEGLPLSPLSFLSRRCSWVLACVPRTFRRSFCGVYAEAGSQVRSRVNVSASSSCIQPFASYTPSSNTTHQWCCSFFFHLLRLPFKGILQYHRIVACIFGFHIKTDGLQPLSYAELCEGFCIGYVCHVVRIKRPTCCYCFHQVGLRELTRR